MNLCFGSQELETSRKIQIKKVVDSPRVLVKE